MGYFSLSGPNLGNANASTAPFQSVQHEIADLNVLPEDTAQVIRQKSCGQQPGFYPSAGSLYHLCAAKCCFTIFSQV